MTDITDHYGRRGAAAGIVDLNAPRRPAIDRAIEQVDRTLAITKEIDDAIPPTPPRKRTDVEQAACWINHLRYLDLVKTCVDIMGDEAKGRELADKIAPWAEKTVERAVADGATSQGARE